MCGEEQIISLSIYAPSNSQKRSSWRYFHLELSIRVVDLNNLSTRCFLCEAGTVCPGGQTANYLPPTIIRSFSSSAEDEVDFKINIVIELLK